MPEEPSTISPVLPSDKIEEIRKEANSALHGDTQAYETSKDLFSNIPIIISGQHVYMFIQASL